MKEPLNYNLKETPKCQAVRWVGNNAEALYKLAGGQTNVLAQNDGIMYLTDEAGKMQPIKIGQWLVRELPQDVFSVCEDEKFTSIWARPPESLSSLPNHTPSVEQIFISGMENRASIKKLVMLAEGPDGGMMMAHSNVSTQDFKNFGNYLVGYIQLVAMMEEMSEKT